MSSALGPTRREVIQAVSPSHTGWTMRVRGRPSGPTVAISHQTMRCARSMNSGSISANDETRIGLPTEFLSFHVNEILRLRAQNDTFAASMHPPRYVFVSMGSNQRSRVLASADPGRPGGRRRAG